LNTLEFIVERVIRGGRCLRAWVATKEPINKGLDIRVSEREDLLSRGEDNYDCLYSTKGAYFTSLFKEA